MGSILVYPENAEQLRVVMDFLKASNIPFQIQEDILPQHVIDGINRSLEQARNGQTISLQEFKAKHFSK